MEKTALITGSARRIGRYLAINLARQGYNLAISYRNSQSEANNLKEYLINNFNIKVETFYVNLDDKQSTINLANQVIARFGDSFTLLINNASIFNKSQFLDDNDALKPKDVLSTAQLLALMLRLVFGGDEVSVEFWHQTLVPTMQVCLKVFFNFIFYFLC